MINSTYSNYFKRNYSIFNIKFKIFIAVPRNSHPITKVMIHIRQYLSDFESEP